MISMLALPFDSVLHEQVYEIIASTSIMSVISLL